MQETFDWLYQRSCENRTQGIDLYNIILSEENILLAYRTIKTNTGSKTKGVDGKTISDYRMLDKESFIQMIRKSLVNYIPQPVKRVEIPKQNGQTRPLGIPTMQDRLIQQMFKQVLEPICEAKFHKHSYGFRPNRSTSHAISRCFHLMNVGKCHYVVDIDIKGFFDNVNHSKLINQLYTIGIKDKRVLCIIGKMLKAPVYALGSQTKGTPQGAILSPLLSNVVLNDLDQWITNQWENFPSKYDYYAPKGKYRALRQTSTLKEMHIVRYADDFKIFTKDHKQAWKIFHAVKGYLENHLKLEISKEKSQVTNLRRRSSEFLGFDIKVARKGKRYVAHSHVSEKKQKEIQKKIKDHIIKVQRNPNKENVKAYNAYVLGIHQYYAIASHVFKDFSRIAYLLSFTMYNRLNKISKHERPRSPPNLYKKLYRTTYKTYKISNTYLYPVTDIHWKRAWIFNQQINNYTQDGRRSKHSKLNITINNELQKMIHHGVEHSSLEYSDNRLSKYSMQKGKCAVSGLFLTAQEVHCHHILPRSLGGTDEFRNLVIVHKYIHRLIHANKRQTIEQYINLFHLKKNQRDKLNNYREKCNLTGTY